MDIVKSIAIFMIIFVLTFGGLLLVYTSRLEEEIGQEIAARGKRKGNHKGIDNEI